MDEFDTIGQDYSPGGRGLSAVWQTCGSAVYWLASGSGEAFAGGQRKQWEDEGRMLRPYSQVALAGGGRLRAKHLRREATSSGKAEDKCFAPTVLVSRRTWTAGCEGKMETVGYLNMSRYVGRECESIVLTCIDFRFRKEVGDLLSRAGFRDFDLVALPGASKAVIEESSRGVLFHAVEASLALHHPRRIIVVDHIDCGAYGGSAAFAGPEDEEAFHAARLDEAREIIRGEFPLLEVVAAYMDWDKLKILSK